MGFLYEVRCSGCGYQVTVSEGAGQRGVVYPSECRDCRALVMVFEELDHRVDEPSRRQCPECGGDQMRSWSGGNQEARDDARLPLKLDPCPKCSGPMQPTGVVGIWD